MKNIMYTVFAGLVVLGLFGCQVEEVSRFPQDITLNIDYKVTEKFTYEGGKHVQYELFTVFGGVNGPDQRNARWGMPYSREHTARNSMSGSEVRLEFFASNPIELVFVVDGEETKEIFGAGNHTMTVEMPYIEDEIKYSYSFRRAILDWSQYEVRVDYPGAIETTPIQEVTHINDIYNQNIRTTINTTVNQNDVILVSVISPFDFEVSIKGYKSKTVEVNDSYVGVALVEFLPSEEL